MSGVEDRADHASVGTLSRDALRVVWRFSYQDQGGNRQHVTIDVPGSMKLAVWDAMTAALADQGREWAAQADEREKNAPVAKLYRVADHLAEVVDALEDDAIGRAKMHAAEARKALRADSEVERLRDEIERLERGGGELRRTIARLQQKLAKYEGELPPTEQVHGDKADDLL